MGVDGPALAALEIGGNRCWPETDSAFFAVGHLFLRGPLGKTMMRKDAVAAALVLLCYKLLSRCRLSAGRVIWRRDEWCGSGQNRTG